MSEKQLPNRSHSSVPNVFCYLQTAKNYAKQKEYNLVLAKKIKSKRNGNGTYEFWVFPNLTVFTNFLVKLPEIEKTFCLIMQSQSRCLYLDIDLKLDIQKYSVLIADIENCINIVLCNLCELFNVIKRDHADDIVFNPQWELSFFVWNASRLRLCDAKLSLHIINKNIAFSTTHKLKDVVKYIRGQNSTCPVTKLFLMGIDIAPYSVCNQFWRIPTCHNGEEASELRFISTLNSVSDKSLEEQLELNNCDM